MVEYKEIPGFPGYYVFRDGRVTDFQRDIKPYFERKGYLRLSLRRGGKQFKVLHHRVIAEAFVPNPDNKPFVNHKNGDKADNRPENLEWSTSKENTKHGYENGLIIRGGGQGSASKLTKEEVVDIKQLIHVGNSNVEIANLFGVSPDAISKIKCGKTWKHVNPLL